MQPHVRARALLVISMVVHTVSARSCILASPLTLQLLLEYAEWRSWDQVVLFDNVTPFNCALSYARPVIECFSEKGISLSLQSATSPNLPDALAIPRHRIGAVVLLDGLNVTSSDDIIQMASQKFLFNYYISWLMVTTRNTDSTIDTVLRDLNIGIDSDVVVATSPWQNDDISWKYAQKYREKICRSFRRYGDRFNFTGPPEGRSVENATTNLSYATMENRSVSFYLTHTYKIRHADNTSLIVRYLGFWNPGSHTLKPPVNVKLRNDFNGLPIIFGILNGTSEGLTDVTEATDVTPLVDFATIVTSSVNASIELVPHEKLGTLTNKVWSHLLGDVVTGTVDIGLGYITSNDEERWKEMTFSHPLIRYMRNIYYHPLEIGTMRDIFLQPFDNRLLGCVAGTYVIMLLAMTTVIYAAKTVLDDKAGKHVGIGEAALWCLSIMCMQGSPWAPRTPSGKTLLLFSLIFSLVMYNAYAGFITSILSVQASGIKSVTDLLFNNFKLGYSIADDTWLRNANDSSLRQLYIKAFNNRESALETTTGLMKAVNGRYGFFVSATLARRALRTTFIQERCTLKELVLPQTLTVVALPMAKTCPYRKIINLKCYPAFVRARRAGQDTGANVADDAALRVVGRFPQREARRRLLRVLPAGGGYGHGDLHRHRREDMEQAEADARDHNTRHSPPPSDTAYSLSSSPSPGSQSCQPSASSSRRRDPGQRIARSRLPDRAAESRSPDAVARRSAGSRRGRSGKAEGAAFPGETKIRGTQESVLVLVRGLVQEENENDRGNPAGSELKGKPGLPVSRMNTTSSLPPLPPIVFTLMQLRRYSQSIIIYK